MKYFEEFVNHIVTIWRNEKVELLHQDGLGFPLPNRTSGNLAEKFIVRKIDKLKPNYNSYISKGSQTPADIYSIARRNSYWHIMLIQVKSSKEKNKIYKLNPSEIKEFSTLVKLIKREIKKSGILDKYASKSIIISTGYVGVYTIESKNNVQKHKLIKAQLYKVFRINSSAFDMIDIKSRIRDTHDFTLR